MGIISRLPECLTEGDVDSFLVVIEFDLIEYRRNYNTKSVKKTLTCKLSIVSVYYLLYSQNDCGPVPAVHLY